jgi:hypothetical protein
VTKYVEGAEPKNFAGALFALLDTALAGAPSNEVRRASARAPEAAAPAAGAIARVARDPR